MSCRAPKGPFPSFLSQSLLLSLPYDTCPLSRQSLLESIGGSPDLGPRPSERLPESLETSQVTDRSFTQAAQGPSSLSLLGCSTASRLHPWKLKNPGLHPPSGQNPAQLPPFDFRTNGLEGIYRRQQRVVKNLSSRRKLLSYGDFPWRQQPHSTWGNQAACERGVRGRAGGGTRMPGAPRGPVGVSWAVQVAVGGRACTAVFGWAVAFPACLLPLSRLPPQKLSQAFPV